MNVLDISTVRAQTVTANDYIVFEDTNVKRGCDIIHIDDTNNVKIPVKGVYMVFFTADVTPSASGETTVALENNGVVIDSSTFTGVANVPNQVVFAKAINVLKSCECAINLANLKISVSAESVVTNAHLVIERKCC